jgi:hypothetical protein
LALEIEKQLAAEAGKHRAATLKQNQATDGIILSEREKGRARDKAAEMTGASPAYVQQAKQIEQDAPEIFEQVKQGKLNIPQAKKVAVYLGVRRQTPCDLPFTTVDPLRQTVRRRTSTSCVESFTLSFELSGLRSHWSIVRGCSPHEKN